MSSDPTTLRKVADVWLATAFASSVLPVPGGPYRMTPFGGLMPISSYNSGCVNGNSTDSYQTIEAIFTKECQSMYWDIAVMFCSNTTQHNSLFALGSEKMKVTWYYTVEFIDLALQGREPTRVLAKSVDPRHRYLKRASHRG